MYRTAADFVADWTVSAAGTLNVIQSITDDKKDFAIVEGHSSLNWLAWHLTSTASGFGRIAGLNIPAIERGTQAPGSVADIAAKYEEISEAYKNEAAKLTDEQLAEEIDALGGKMIRGKLLRLLIDHQTHHRGQMTVLLRQAGLPVPGVMGPTQEMRK
ncbi:DinB family protein [Cohnella cellulosilytica]|uniref:DinB family protein n=1 Tax=Cohnella cellulosilytica TaxID=986710 RepID=A0ABW2FFV3_9BACL